MAKICDMATRHDRGCPSCRVSGITPGRRVGAHALGCVESCARGLVAGGGEPAGVQILPIRVRLEAMQVRACGT